MTQGYELLKAVFTHTLYVGKDEEKMKQEQEVYLFVAGIVVLAELLTPHLLITAYRRALIIWISI